MSGLTPTRAIFWLVALSALALACALPGREPGAVIEWVAGHEAPAFDPDGPPDALRWSIERHLSRGLTDEDSTGRIVPAAAESIATSADGLTVRFRLRPELTFTDGRRCTSEDFRAALRGGLARPDHGTRGALLGALAGVGAVRVGHRLPSLGIETPDPRTLVLRLSHPDSLLLRKLSIPGVSSPWRRRAPGEWREACGLGPYHVATWEPGRRLTLVRRGTGGRIDTLRIRFMPSAVRVRNLLRGAGAGLVWPIPPALLDQPLPAGFQIAHSTPWPPRHLLLVMRADVPPTSKLPARRVLAHALNRSDVAASLGTLGAPPGALITGSPPFESPKYDAGEVSSWLARGDLGRSFHVAMAYDAEGAGAAASRALQGGWSRFNLYVELRPLRTAAFTAEALQGQSHLLLVESQPLLASPASWLAALVMPLRGPAVGAFRTGWRTREFDAWIMERAGAPAFPPEIVQHRLEEELRVVPLAQLPWARVVPGRSTPGAIGTPVAFHPHYGADFVGNAVFERLPTSIGRIQR